MKTIYKTSTLQGQVTHMSASELIHPSGNGSLQWRYNGRDSVSNHQSHDCLLNRLFRRRSKKTSKLRVTGVCAGNSPGTGEFPAQMASNAEKMFPFDDVIMLWHFTPSHCVNQRWFTFTGRRKWNNQDSFKKKKTFENEVCKMTSVVFRASMI